MVNSLLSNEALVLIIRHLQFLNLFGSGFILADEVEVVVVQVPVHEFELAGIESDN